MLAMDDRRRIALVITELEPGGAERCLVHLATGLPTERFITAVYCLAARPARDRDCLVRRLERQAIPTHFLGARTIWQAPSTLRRLGRALRDFDPDIVQSFLFHANVLSALAVGGRKRPALFTGIRVADPSRWRQRVEAWTSRRARQVVCVSRDVADFCRAHTAFPSDKLCVIPNGIDPASYQHPAQQSARQLGLPEDRRILLYVGRLHRQKAVDWLLDQAPRFLATLPQHDLVLVGDGPERRALQQQAERLGIAHRVHFLGYRDDIPDLLAVADLLILPSQWEGMPNVVLEAMASRLPVVATRAAGVLELLGPLADQQTVQHGDGHALVEAIIRVVQHPEVARQWGQANHERVLQHFHLRQLIENYTHLYHQATVQPP